MSSLFVALLLTACAGRSTTTTGTTTGSATVAATTTSATPAPTGARSPDIITESEVQAAATTGVSNAFDLVRRLRPNFLRNNERTSLRNNSAAPIVRLNGQILGELTELRGIEIGVVQQIRYYSIVQAESTFPSGDRGRPVIAVTTKKLTK